MEKKNNSSADRLLTVLSTLTDQKTLTAQETAEMLGIDKSNAYRLLHKLLEYGFVTKSHGRYYIQNTFSSGSMLNPYAFAEYAKDSMKHLVQYTNISAHLCMMTSGGAAFIAQEMPAERINAVQPIGKEEPFYCTASGKVMLAFLPEKLQNQLIDKIILEQHTDSTVKSKEELRRQLQQVREQGYAIDDCEFHPNVSCICVPIFDDANLPSYALGLSKVILHEEHLDYPYLKKVLDKYAKRISRYFSMETAEE